MEWERQRAYDFADGKQEGLTEGFQQGAQQKEIEAILGFASNNVSEEIIAKSLKMTLEDVHKIIVDNKK